MSRGNGGVGIAALVAALLIAFGLGAYWTALPSPYQGSYPSYQYPGEDKSGTATAAEMAYPTQHQTPCQNEQGRDESDLCAQWRAANAAEESATWTRWGFFAGIVGMFGLYWQIFLTREAVKETGAATDAMIASNAITLAGQRPWISIDAQLNDIKSTLVVVSFDCTVDFHNTGEMIAEDVTTVIDVMALDPETSFESIRLWFERHRKAVKSRQSSMIPDELFQSQINAGKNLQFMPWQDGTPKFCQVFILGFVAYRISGEEEWRFTARSFVIGSKGGKFMDRYHFTLDNVSSSTSEEDLQVRRYGPSFSS